MGRVIGIDLGTTNTAVAIVTNDKPTVLKDSKGYTVIPSCVCNKGEGRYVVGHAAKSLVLTSPERTVYGVKRLIGRKFDSPEVQEAVQNASYDMRESSDGMVEVEMGGEWFSRMEVSSIILQVAKGVAEASIGEEVSEAVITVPAYFNHSQRAATLEAARLAGLECERLINEPTAAALAFGFNHKKDQAIVIFDLGGGTFDVSVLHLTSGVYEVLSTSGDTYLGGEDFDFRLLHYLIEVFAENTGETLFDDPTALQRVREAAERAKCDLSFTEVTDIFIPQLTRNENLELSVTRGELDEMVEDLVERAIAVTLSALEQSGLEASDIGEVVLVGGQTRMPLVQTRLAEIFGKEPSRGVHPEEVVAVGAALHGATLEGVSEGTLLIDVTPFDVGIDSAAGTFTVLIDRNSKIPSSRTRSFTTVVNNQSEVRIVVRQGHSSHAVENEFLGEFVLQGLTPMPRMENKLDVNFRLDSNGMLHVTATERSTGEQKQIVIRNYVESSEGKEMTIEEVVSPRPIGEGPIERGLK